MFLAAGCWVSGVWWALGCCCCGVWACLVGLWWLGVGRLVVVAWWVGLLVLVWVAWVGLLWLCGGSFAGGGLLLFCCILRFGLTHVLSVGAVALLEEMKCVGLVPDVETFDVVIAVCARSFHGLPESCRHCWLLARSSVSPGRIGLHHSGFCIIDVDVYICKMPGYTQEELEGRSILAIMSPVVASGHTEMIFARLQTASPDDMCEVGWCKPHFSRCGSARENTISLVRQLRTGSASEGLIAGVRATPWC